MRAVTQRGRQLDAPCPRRAGGGGAEQGGAFIEANLRICRACPPNQRQGFVGRLVADHVARDAARAVHGQGDDRGNRRYGVDGDVKGRGRIAGVTRGIRRHDDDRMRPLGERVFRGEAPCATCPYLGRADFHAIHLNADGGPGFPGAVQGRTGVVSGGVVPDDNRSAGEIVDHGGDRRGVRGGGINHDAPAVGSGAGVARGIHGLRREDVAAVRQRGGELDLPGAALAGLRGADQRRAAVELNRRVGRAGAADQRRCIVGGLPVSDGAGHAGHVVHHIHNHRDGRRRGVRGGDLAFRTGVSGSVGGGDRQQFAVLFRRGKGDGEAAGVIDHPGADHRVAIAHGDGTACFTPASEGAAIVKDREAVRCARGKGINGDGSHRGCRAEVARRIGGNGGEGMLAILKGDEGFIQRPLSLIVGEGLAYQGLTVVNAHGCAGFGGAVEGWTGVVGRIAVKNRTLHRTDVIHHRGDERCDRSGGIDVDDKPFVRWADVARRIGGGHRQRMFPVSQRRRWGKAPGVVRPNSSTAQQRGAVVNVHCAARFGRAAEGRSGVVGQLATGEIHRLAYIIRDRDQDRRVRQLGIYCQGEWRGRIADISCRIDRHRGEAVHIIAKLCVHLDRPAAIGIGDAFTDQGLTIENLHPGIWFAGAGEHRLLIVGGTAAGERPGHRVNIVNRQRDHWRGWFQGIDNQREARRGFAEVARRVNGAGGEGVAAVAQGRGWGPAPLPGFRGLHGGNLGTVIVNHHRGVGFSGAG